MELLFILLGCILSLVIFMTIVLGYILLYDHIRGKIKGYGTGKQIKMEN